MSTQQSFPVPENRVRDLFSVAQVTGIANLILNFAQQFGDLSVECDPRCGGQYCCFRSASPSQMPQIFCGNATRITARVLRKLLRWAATSLRIALGIHKLRGGKPSSPLDSMLIARCFLLGRWKPRATHPKAKRSDTDPPLTLRDVLPRRSVHRVLELILRFLERYGDRPYSETCEACGFKSCAVKCPDEALRYVVRELFWICKEMRQGVQKWQGWAQRSHLPQLEDWSLAIDGNDGTVLDV